MKCQHCGRELGAGTTRCFYCSAIMGRQCPRCKSILPMGAEVCAVCKAEIPEETPDYILPVSNLEPGPSPPAA